MNSSPVSLIRRVRVLALLTLAVILTTAAFNSTSAASYFGRLLGGASHAAAHARTAPPARHHLANAPAPRTALEQSADTPFVTTDQTDYKPGDTVVIFGSGWAAGETVKLVVHEESSSRDDKELSADADEYGNILNKEFSPTEENLGSSFTLTATGQSSGRTASAKFTDGGSMSYSQAGFSATVFSGPSSSTSAFFTQNITAPGGNGSFRADAVVTPTGGSQLPASWVTVTPGSRNFNTGPANNPHPDSNSWNVSITPPANTPAGVYTATLFAVPNTASVQKGLGTAIQLTVSADSAPPTTSLSAADASNNPYNGVNFISTAKVTITLTATDAGGSGVSATRYKIDNGQFKNYSGPFDIANEGLSVITYFSIDNTGAQETAHFFTVKIDRTVPTISCGTADGQWHASDVSITCTAADAGGQQTSGLANPSDASFSLSTNVPADTETGNAQTGTHDVCDNAGNCATAGPVGGNKVDKKAPLVSCAPDDGSWHANNVSITCTATDGGSGLGVGVTSPFTVLTNVADGDQTDNASVNVPAIADAVGNVTPSSTISNIKVDRKAPSITASAVRADNNSPYNAGDWVNQNVVVSFQCSDTGGSGVASVDGPITVSGEGANQSVTGHCADNVGHTAQASFGPVNIDKTPPVISAAPDRPPNAHGWYKADVTVTPTASDALSGIDTVDPALTLGEGANQSASFTARDKAGNTASASVSGINVDETAPTINASRTPAANGAGWNNTDVTASANAADSLSGVDFAASTLADVLFSSEGAGQHTTFTVVDNAGNSASATVSDINIDKTDPTLSFDSYTPAANGAGWNNTNVSVAFTPGDALSGVGSTSASSPLVLSAEGSAVTGSVTVTDNAGNSKTFNTSAVKIDKTPPTLNPTRHTGSEANGAGWNNSAVTVDANAGDTLSGVASVSPSASQTVSGEGANQSVTFKATDVAGNTATASLGGINIDLTPPTINASRAPAANAFGWNNTNVTASYTAGDSLSGLSDPANGSFDFTNEGASQSHTFTVHDAAGNTASATVSGVNIDKTAPSVTINAPTAGTYLLNQTVAANFGCSDGGSPPSGIDTCTGTVSNGAGIDTSSVGSHTFNVTAKDKAGNTASKSVTYGVVYAWSGFLQPINLDGSSVFKLGSTVPVKFQLVGGSAGVTNATNFTLWVAKVSNSVVGSEIEAVTSTPASTGNLFRYDPTGGIYIYNMGTKGAPWTAGTWQLRVDLGDGAPPRTVLISLKP